MAVRTVGKKKKFKFKWTIELFLLLGFLLAFIIADICLSLPNERDLVVNAWTENVSNKTDVRKISEDDLENRIKNSKDSELIFVFFGCPVDESSKTTMRKIDGLLSFMNQKIEDLNKDLDKATIYWLDNRYYFNYEDKDNSYSFHNIVKEKYDKFKGLDFGVSNQFVVYDSGNLIKKSENVDVEDFGYKYLSEYITRITK